MLDSVAMFDQFPFRLHALQGKLAIATLDFAIVIMVKVRTRYFYYTDCQLKEECSKPAWERANKCVATDPDTARKQLAHHLQLSGKHWSRNLSDHDAGALADIADLSIHDTDVEEEETPLPRPSSSDGKRQRLALQDAATESPTPWYEQQHVDDADDVVTKAINTIEKAAKAARHAE